MNKGKIIKRIYAFTIIELVVVLLISGIIVSMSYYAILVFNRQFKLYHDRSARISSFLLFKKTLQQDCDKSPLIMDSADRLLLFDEPGGGKIANYEFAKDFIVRH